MSKAFLPLGILAAAGVMGSLAGGQGSPARRRYIRPEVEEHYIQGVRDPAFVLGLTRPQQLALWWYANTLSGPQAVRIQEIVELHQAGELPTVDRDWVNPSHPGRSARGRRAAPTTAERRQMGQKLQALPWSQASALYRRNHPEYKGIGGYPMNTKLRASGARSYGVAAYNAGKLTKKDVEIIFRRTSRRYPSMPKFDAMVCKTRKNGKHRNCKSVTSR